MAFSFSTKRSSWADQITPCSSHHGHSQISKRETLHHFNKNKTCMGSMEVPWLEYLKKSNHTIQNQRVQTLPFLAVPAIIVDLIFLICRELHQPPDVRYLAVELFDRFVYQHHADLTAKIWCSSKFDEPSNQWDKVLVRVQNQILMRLLSCIEIASKFVISDSDKVIRGRAVQEFLRGAGKVYSLSSILASEIRVFRTLGYKVHLCTTLVYTDFLLELLNLADGISRTKLHEISIPVLDIAYLYHQEIYHKLHYISTGCWERTEQERFKFLPIECNGLYLASAVIITCVNIVLPNQEGIATEICKQLDQLTAIPTGDIEGLAAIITEQIIIT